MVFPPNEPSFDPDFSKKEGAWNLPEGERSQSGVKLRIQQPDLIVSAMERGIRGVCLDQLLSQPFSAIKVELDATSSPFNITCYIEQPISPVTGRWRPDQSKSMHFSDNVLQRVIKRLEAYGTSQERGGCYISRAPNGETVVLMRDITGPGGGLKISSGEVRNSILGNSRILVERTQADFPNMRRILEAIVETASIALNESYTMTQMPAPTEDIVIRPPKESITATEKRALFMRASQEQQTLPDLFKESVIQPEASLEDIGGNEIGKRAIEKLAFALQSPETYTKWAAVPPKGLLLTGAPGTGKTMLARALAGLVKDSRCYFVDCEDVAAKGSENLEDIVTEIFGLAATNSGKTILCLDAVQALVSNSANSPEENQRVQDSFRKQMGDLRSNPNVVVVATTDRLESVNGPLRSESCFDQLVEIPIPNQADRKQILSIYMRAAARLAGRPLFEYVNIDQIVQQTAGLVGADLNQLVQRVLNTKADEERLIGREPDSITTVDFLEQLTQAPRLPETNTTAKTIEQEKPGRI